MRTFKKHLQIGALMAITFLFTNNTKAQIIQAEFNEVAFFDFNDKLVGSYEAALQMRFKDAKVALQEEKARNIYNLMPQYVDDYIDFLRVFINESKVEYENLKNSKNNRLAKLKQGDQSSPYYLYTQAEVHTRWALLETKFANYSDAISDFKEALALVEENKKKFPDFEPNRKVVGMLHVVLGSSPQGAKVISGFKPSVEQGIADLQSVMRYGERYKTFQFTTEVHIIYGMLLLYLGTTQESDWEVIDKDLLDYKNNPMAAYGLASRYLGVGESKKAILVLEAAPQSNDYHKIYFLDYLRGLAELYSLNTSAERYFNHYLSEHRGGHYVKDAYQKIAWTKLLKGDGGAYRSTISKVKKEGVAVLPSDRMAYDEAAANAAPNVALLKTKLLCKGGFYDRAYTILETVDEKSLKTNDEKIEYHYWWGIVHQKMKSYDQAIRSYQKAVDVEKKSKNYLAASAAVNMGMIYEKREREEDARAAYSICLKLDPAYYKGVLHSRAQKRHDRLRAK